MAGRIYLDHAATTPLCEEARLAMEPWLRGGFGNPSSLHAEGRKAKDAIDEARETLSSLLNCLFAEVLFTGSGTEAANLAILGSALQNEDPGRNRVLLGAGEHHCVLHTRPILERLGYRVDIVPIDRIARIRLDVLEELLGDDVLLVSVMAANNEFGTLQPVEQIAALAHQRGALFHCDAVQTMPWQMRLPIGADIATFSAHKLNGSKGVGGIYLRAGLKVKPWIVGGAQEREVRAGTENVAGIVGFAAAAKASASRPPYDAPAQVFRDALASTRGWQLSVSNSEHVLPSHVHGRLVGSQAETVLILLDRLGIAAGSGAACSSGSLEPSHVMLAAGYSSEEAKEGLRFTFGHDSSVAEAERAGKIVAEAFASLTVGR